MRMPAEVIQTRVVVLKSGHVVKDISLVIELLTEITYLKGILQDGILFNSVININQGLCLKTFDLIYQIDTLERPPQAVFFVAMLFLSKERTSL